jgi:hypothetical protein
VQSVGCNRIKIELDCLEVINIMREGENSLDIAATVIDDCYYLVREGENSYRKANCAAHGLAMVARGSMEQVWPTDPSDFLILHALDDITSILYE